MRSAPEGLGHGSGRPIPWKKPAHETLLIVLVAVAGFLPLYRLNAQDHSRICLAEAYAQGRVSYDSCFVWSFDKAAYANHLYSDKAPGMSVAEIPVVEAVGLGLPGSWHDWFWKLWVVRVLSSGIAFLLCAFMVGRVAEGLAPGFGAPSLVAFALGTLAFPFAAANFGHLPAAALGFGAFLLAWRRKTLLAGLLAGTAVAVEYQAGVILVALAVYCWRRGLLRYALGAIPGVAFLAAYDWAAFGAPWRLSYDYVANSLATEQSHGLFGIGLPHVRSLVSVFFGQGGLLVLSPVLVASAYGLVLLARTWRREAILCGAVTAAFIVVDSGYFLAYGGVSPGPRFLVPSLPFLCTGLGLAFAWRPRLTAILTVLSVVPTTVMTLMWASHDPIHGTVWGELVTGRFWRSTTPTILKEVGVGKLGGALVLFAVVAAALVVALRGVQWRRGWALTPAIAAAASLILVADVCAAMRFPYKTDEPPGLGDPLTSAVATSGTDVFVTVTNPARSTIGDTGVQITLADGIELAAPPAPERGTCKGTHVILCTIGELGSGWTTTIQLHLAPGSAGKIDARPTLFGVPANHGGAATVA